MLAISNTYPILMSFRSTFTVVCGIVRKTPIDTHITVLMAEIEIVQHPPCPSPLLTCEGCIFQSVSFKITSVGFHILSIKLLFKSGFFSPLRTEKLSYSRQLSAIRYSRIITPIQGCTDIIIFGLCIQRKINRSFFFRLKSYELTHEYDPLILTKNHTRFYKVILILQRGKYPSTRRRCKGSLKYPFKVEWVYIVNGISKMVDRISVL